jgi:RsiW-degrading membrane proteinase PrsW (M82 family)
MEHELCCVCQQLVDGDAPRLGGRAYCHRHYAKVGRDRASVWRTCLVAVGVLVVFTLVVAILAKVTKPQLDGLALVLTGVGLALVPAFLGVFALGALLASAVGMPVIQNVFRVQDWLGHSLAVNLLGSILVVGIIQEFLKYAAVRYSIYLLPEFDERMDGILYGTAAGLGYATMLNVRYVIDSGGVNLEMGIIRIVVTTLAQASFAGITGYFLARAKFEEEPVWWLPLGLGIAAVLNGLALAAVVAALTLLALLYLMGRANRAMAAGSQET